VNLGDVLGRRNWASWAMHLEAEIELNSVIQLEAVMKRILRWTWRPTSSD